MILRKYGDFGAYLDPFLGHLPTRLTGPRGRMCEWLTCLFRVLLLMWMGLIDVFHQFHLLKVTKDVESLIFPSLIACLPRLASFLGRPGRSGCYIMSAHKDALFLP